MKQIAILILLLFIGQFSKAQSEGPKEITPQVLQKIKADVEKQVLVFKQKLASQNLTKDEIEFSVDTFRIEQIASKRIDLDYSTAGMNTTVSEMTDAYDQLMNKYYNKLLKLLKPEDAKILITAQRAWIIYRDSETKLIGAMTKEEYSGGGTIQSMIAVGSYSDMVIQRTIKIFNYYDNIIKEE